MAGSKTHWNDARSFEGDEGQTWLRHPKVYVAAEFALLCVLGLLLYGVAANL